MGHDGMGVLADGERAVGGWAGIVHVWERDAVVFKDSVFAVARQCYQTLSLVLLLNPYVSLRR